MNHDKFRLHMKNVFAGKKPDPAFIQDYLSHTPDKTIGFYLKNITYEIDSDIMKLKVTPDILSVATLYAQWLSAHFEPEKVKSFFMDNTFHKNYQKNIYTFSLSSESYYFDENLLASLRQFKTVFDTLPIKEQLMLEYVNSAYSIGREELEPGIGEEILYTYYQHTLQSDVEKMKIFHQKITDDEMKSMSDKYMLEHSTNQTANKKSYKL